MSGAWAEALSTIVVAVITGLAGVLVAYLRSRLTLAQREKIVGAAWAAVQAVELIGASQGWTSAEKKAQALARAAELTGLSTDRLDTYIEAAVSGLKASGAELVKSGGAVVTKS